MITNATPEPFTTGFVGEFILKQISNSKDRKLDVSTRVKTEK
jgi:hypothetical protein